MALFWSMILAFVVVCAVVMALQLLKDGIEVVEVGSVAQGLPERKFLGITENGWYMAVMLGVLVGLVTYFAPLSSSLTFVAPLCYVTMLGLFCFLMVWWHREGSELSEMIPFIVLAVLFYFPAKSAASATAELIASQPVAQILVILPTCFLVVSIGFFIADYFYFRSEMEALSKRGESSWRV